MRRLDSHSFEAVERWHPSHREEAGQSHAFGRGNWGGFGRAPGQEPLSVGIHVTVRRQDNHTPSGIIFFFILSFSFSFHGGAGAVSAVHQGSSRRANGAHVTVRRLGSHTSSESFTKCATPYFSLAGSLAILNCRTRRKSASDAGFASLGGIVTHCISQLSGIKTSYSRWFHRHSCLHRLQPFALITCVYMIRDPYTVSR
jgi:hypothetical protein